MANALDGIAALRGRSLEDQDPAIGVALRTKKLLDEMKRNLALNGPRGSGATAADIASAEDDLKNSPYSDEATAGRNAFDQKLQQANDPRVKSLEAEELANKLKLATAPAEAQAKGLASVETIKEEGANKRQREQLDEAAKLRESLGIGGSRTSGGGGSPNDAALGRPGSFKPSINAKGEVSFTETTMPALVQRANNQLSDARSKTLLALQEAERMYPGINDEAGKADESDAPGWLSFASGVGGHKYGSAMDLAKAANDRLKYTVGVPTPFSNLAQAASFGNIEQMAGQLPGVRGLATITPLFKEHQSRWGKETPLATVQRLRHMASIMDDTLSTIQSGGGEANGFSTAQGAY